MAKWEEPREPIPLSFIVGNEGKLRAMADKIHGHIAHCILSEGLNGTNICCDKVCTYFRNFCAHYQHCRTQCLSCEKLRDWVEHKKYCDHRLGQPCLELLQKTIHRDTFIENIPRRFAERENMPGGGEEERERVGAQMLLLADRPESREEDQQHHLQSDDHDLPDRDKDVSISPLSSNPSSLELSIPPHYYTSGHSPAASEHSPSSSSSSLPRPLCGARASACACVSTSACTCTVAYCRKTANCPAPPSLKQHSKDTDASAGDPSNSENRYRPAAGVHFDNAADLRGEIESTSQNQRKTLEFNNSGTATSHIITPGFCQNGDCGSDDGRGGVESSCCSYGDSLCANKKEEEEEVKKKCRVGPSVDFDCDGLPSKFVESGCPTKALEDKKIPEQCNQLLPDEEGSVEIENDVSIRRKTRKQLLGHFFNHTYEECTHWSRVCRIGGGSGGTVYCIKDEMTNYLLTLKECNESKSSLDEAYLCLQLAKDCLRKMNPVNIVEFYGASMHMVPRRPIGVIQMFEELMSTCLHGYLFSNGPSSEDKVRDFAYQLFEALDFLHNNAKVVHLDLKPANLLIDSTGQRLKVADFGCAMLLTEEIHFGVCFKRDGRAGTHSYNPPEYYDSSVTGFCMDIWQAGCCILSMLTSRRPWRHLFMDCCEDRDLFRIAKARIRETQRRLISQQRCGHIRPSFVEDEGLQKLLFACLHSEPTYRPTARQCKAILADTEPGENEKQRMMSYLGKIGCHDLPPVLNHYRSTRHVCVDVYLGNERVLMPCGASFPAHCLQGGWVASLTLDREVEYTTALLRQWIPVLQHFPPFMLCTCENSPQGIWRTFRGHPGGVAYGPFGDSVRVSDTRQAIVLCATHILQQQHQQHRLQSQATSSQDFHFHHQQEQREEEEEEEEVEEVEEEECHARQSTFTTSCRDFVS